MSESGFIDWLVKTMLGWARWLTDMMWNSINSTSARGGAVGWFGRNWTRLALIMIIVGIVLDWLIWMIRWRPYWLWFRKRQIIYADEGETPLSEQADEAPQIEADASEDIDIFAPRRKTRAKYEEDPFLDNTLVPESRPSEPEPDDEEEEEEEPAPSDGYRVMFAPQEKSHRHVMFEDEEYDDPFQDEDEE